MPGPKSTILPTPLRGSAAPTVAEIDTALRIANAEGLLRYTLAELDDERLRCLRLEAQLTVARRTIERLTANAHRGLA